MASSSDLSFLECEKVQQSIKQWQEWDANPADIAELSQLIASKNAPTLCSYFTQRYPSFSPLFLASRVL
jgi:hypothetical protein